MIQKFKILLIEDDRIVLNNLEALFYLNDYEVFTSTNGPDGIILAEEIKPDIIICDVVMTCMNGYDVLKYIRSSIELFATPFIFLSGCDENYSLRTGMELGADDYITKPYDNNVLLNAVNSRLLKHIHFKKHYEGRIENMKKTMIFGVPHEFRTPMNTILGFSHFLRDNCSQVSPDEAYKMLDMINRAGTRLLNQLININLYYSFHTEFNFDKIENEYIDNPIFVIEEQATDVGLMYDKSFTITKLTDELKIRIYNDYYRKIVTEIIDNAYKFSNKNNIEIIVESTDDKFVISITNFWKPLTEIEIAKIGAFTQFDREFQEQQGSGLGLTISKVLTQLYGGSVEISSDKIQSNTVKITFIRVIE